MIELKRILFPTDFSDCSSEAKKYACTLTEQFDAELHVLHVVPRLVGFEPRIFSPGDLKAYQDSMTKQAQDQLASVLDSDWRSAHRVVTELRQGTPFVEIVRYSKETNIDVIVISTHGRTGIPHMLLGSVAEKVVRKAPCPVLTVRPSGYEFVMP
jgi:nucleotide-binding universal stress UspA family protein